MLTRPALQAELVERRGCLLLPEQQISQAAGGECSLPPAALLSHRENIVLPRELTALRRFRPCESRHTSFVALYARWHPPIVTDIA